MSPNAMNIFFFLKFWSLWCLFPSYHPFHFLCELLSLSLSLSLSLNLWY
jgi:hypothetical protein